MIFNYTSKNGPIEIIQNIAMLFSEEAGPDQRATIMVFTANGNTWRGVPVVFQNQGQNQRSYFVIQTKESTLIMIFADQVTSIEIQNQHDFESFLMRPWQTSERFGSISKIQLIREIETEWKELSPPLTMKLDSFPKDDFIFGASLAWVLTLKSVLNKLVLEFPNALLGYKGIEVHYSDQGMCYTKSNHQLKINCDFRNDSFNKIAIFEELNRLL